MATPLYTTDVQKIVDRTPKTTLLDTDVFVVADEDGTLAPITKPNVKATLDIDKAETDISLLQTAETAIKGTGWTDENLVDHETRIGDLETNDTLQDATLGTLKETVLTTKLAVNELERQSQIGNGATLDFSDIGIVPLDARATGRANPTIEGLTVTNLVPAMVDTDASGLADGWSQLSTTGRSFSDGEQTFTATAQNGYIHKYFTVKANDYFFLSALIQCDITSATDIQIQLVNLTESPYNNINAYLTSDGVYQRVYVAGQLTYNAIYTLRIIDRRASGWTPIKFKEVELVNLTSIYGSGNEPTASECAKIFSYFDGTKSIQLPARIVSKSEDESESSTIYIADNEEVRSVPAISDEVKVVNGELVHVKRVEEYTLTEADIVGISNRNNVAYVDTRTFPDCVELTTPINNWVSVDGKKQLPDYTYDWDVVGNDTNSTFSTTVGQFLRFFLPLGTSLANAKTILAGTIVRYQLATPIITPLTTSGILQAKQNGTVYYEPYYEGSHQTNASSQITLPYEGTIEAVYGYDDDLVEYLLDSSEYSLTGTTLTITDALENEVWFVKMSRAEPLAPEMSVNVINNAEVAEDSVTGKFYKKTFTVADGVPTFGIEEVV